MKHPIKNILCPIDCSEGSRVALEHASALADKFDAQILVLHAWHVTYHVRPDLSVWGQSSGQESLLDVVKSEAQAAVDAFVAKLDEATRRRTTVKVVQGDEVPSIVDAAENEGIDLIVMGTHGRSGISRVALGSVAERVVRHAPCPVLTVRIRDSKKGA
jgi:nucleotide-binding universal stress UspA family protein